MPTGFPAVAAVILSALAALQLLAAVGECRTFLVFWFLLFNFFFSTRIFVEIFFTSRFLSRDRSHWKSSKNYVVDGGRANKGERINTDVFFLSGSNTAKNKSDFQRRQKYFLSLKIFSVKKPDPVKM